jgi:alpha-methylacyl-CoA racemase
MLKDELAVLFKTRTRDEWMALFADGDTCVTPVLTLAEAAGHPQHRARHSFIDVGGLEQQAPAPRFSRTPAAKPLPPPKPGGDAAAVAADWGIDPSILDI